MTPEEIAAKACLEGTKTPNGIKDLPDIFWLMGWADWEIERQFLDFVNKEEP